MDLRQLRYFIRIVEMKNLGRAAAELGIAQSALGWHLGNLEREVNVPLVNRYCRYPALLARRRGRLRSRWR